MGIRPVASWAVNATVIEVVSVIISLVAGFLFAIQGSTPALGTFTG